MVPSVSGIVCDSSAVAIIIVVLLTVFDRGVVADGLVVGEISTLTGAGVEMGK